MHPQLSHRHELPVMNVNVDQIHFVQDVYLNGTTVHHILAGSFRSLSLFLLVFTYTTATHSGSLSLSRTIPAFGPHQYLATNPEKTRVYTTSWALPPLLSTWAVERDDWSVNHINDAPITATSSYISLPPPYTHLYSTGGPTGEVHLVDPSTGSFGTKVQQVLFVPEDELEKADKTRIALRYGSHAVEIYSQGYAFIPVLGANSIETYTIRSTNTTQPQSPLLTHLCTTHSPRPHDGPRHLKVHPNGNILYVVTEHSNYLDVYLINDITTNTEPNATSTPQTLSHIQSRSLIPSHLRTDDAATNNTKTGTNTLPTPIFRGDTLALSPPTELHPSPRHIFTTTRGAAPRTRGWVGVWRLGEDGLIDGREGEGEVGVGSRSKEVGDGYVERWETPTSGGKANAIELLAKSESEMGMGSSSADRFGTSVWIVLTDDEEGLESGAVRVLEWDGENSGGIRVVAELPADDSRGDEGMQGGSHAIWLD